VYWAGKNVIKDAVGEGVTTSTKKRSNEKWPEGGGGVWFGGSGTEVAAGLVDSSEGGRHLLEGGWTEIGTG